jgi:hypothetical protein
MYADVSQSKIQVATSTILSILYNLVTWHHHQFEEKSYAARGRFSSCHRKVCALNKRPLFVMLMKFGPFWLATSVFG